LLRAARLTARLTYHRPRGWWRVLLNQGAALGRTTYAPALPVHISIEPTAHCDMGCPVCETGAEILGRPQGTMSFEAFTRIVDAIHPHAHTIFLYFMGEPFLNKRIYDMIRYAKDRGIYVSLCTNGHFVDPERTVAAGLDEISFQLGGLDQPTHEVYRVRGRLQRQLDNLQALVAEKKRRGSRAPWVQAGFIVMRHNESQVDEFLRVARDEWGVDEAAIIPPCVRTVEQGRQFLTADDRYWFYDRRAFEEHGVLKPKQVMDNRCWWIWHSAMITWNGDVVPCCRDAKGTNVLGNVLEEDFASIWNGPRYRAFRRRILTAQREVAICSLCSSYPVPDLNVNLKRPPGAPR
jgi:radical SAM protein with 4Fe4S-binding SPASM domain